MIFCSQINIEKYRSIYNILGIIQIIFVCLYQQFIPLLCMLCFKLQKTVNFQKILSYIEEHCGEVNYILYFPELTSIFYAYNYNTNTNTEHIIIIINYQ